MNDDSAILSLEEALLEDKVLEAVLGDGTVSFSFEFPQGRQHSLVFQWPSFHQAARVRRLTERYAPNQEEYTQQWLLAYARATLEVLWVDDGQQRTWLPVASDGRPDILRMRSRSLLEAIAMAWLLQVKEIHEFLYRDSSLNLKRMATMEDLRLKDLVARQLNTHPFDPRVSALSEAQAYLLLELRYPADAKDEETAKIQEEAELADARDEYHYGPMPDAPSENEGSFDLDLALYAQ